LKHLIAAKPAGTLRQQQHLTDPPKSIPSFSYDHWVLIFLTALFISFIGVTWVTFFGFVGSSSILLASRFVLDYYVCIVASVTLTPDLFYSISFDEKNI
jgi:hypothetical protein